MRWMACSATCDPWDLNTSTNLRRTWAMQATSLIWPERTLFIIDWLLDADMQRRAQIGLNKGEAHHALKNALRIGRQGEIRDRTSEGQHFRMAGLNLLTAIIIYWNTKHLGQAVAGGRRNGLDCSSDLLAHISPLGWAHILLTGEYRWPKR